MSLLRRLYRAALLLLWFAFMAIISLPFKIGGWNSIRRVCGCTRLWGRGIAGIMNLKIRLIGDPADFEGGLIVSNHQSYLDIIIHAATFPIRFSPKSDIRSWPFLGWYLGISRPIWVNRSSRQESSALVGEFRTTMEHRIPLVIYPEGTTTDGRHGVLPFKSTPFEAVASTNLPILPIITVFNATPDEKTLAWIGNDTLLPHVWRVLGYSRMEAEVHRLPIVYPDGLSRKKLAEKVHAAMETYYWEIMAKKGLARATAVTAFNLQGESHV